MTDVTIIKGAVTFTFENGEVDSVKSHISTQPDEMPMPGAAPMNTIQMDMGGAKKTVTISGALIESASTRTSTGTVKTILEQKQWLEKIIDGQQSIVTFTSNYESSSVNGVNSLANTTALVKTVDFEEKTKDPNELPFTIILQVGTG